MYRLFFTPFIIFAGACSTSSAPPGTDKDTDGPAETDVIATPTPVDTDIVIDTDTGTAILSTFPGGTYKVTQIAIMPTNQGIDLDGDGVVNNQLPGLLNAADLVLSGTDMNVAAVNDRIAEVLLNERTIALLTASHDLGVLKLGILQGIRDDDGILGVDPASYDGRGQPRQKFTGSFRTQERFEAGPGSVSLPFQFSLDEPILSVTAEQARLAGDLDVFELNGAVAGAFSIPLIMTQIVEPLVVDNIPEDEQASLLASIEAVVAAAADLELNGEPAVSGAFRLIAEAAEW